MRRALILAATLLAASPANAAETDGPFGLRDNVLLTLQGLYVGNDGLTADAAPVAKDLSGSGMLLRFQGGGFMRATRFGTFAGLEVNMAMGWLGRSGIVADSGQLDGMTFGRFYWDLEAGLNLAIWHRADQRLSLTTGVGMSSDFYYVSPGLKAAFRVAGQVVEAAYAYHWGSSWSDADLDEHRIAATLVLDKHRWGVGAEVWLGSAGDAAAADRALRGDYAVGLVNLSRRW